LPEDRSSSGTAEHFLRCRDGAQPQLKAERITMMKTEIPFNAKRVPLRPVALGEVTGHHHSFLSNVQDLDVGDLVEMYEGEDGNTYVRVKGEPGAVSLVHQEHKPHLVEPGEYSVVIQQENTDWGARPVAD
jgi:hypothetical protein